MQDDRPSDTASYVAMGRALAHARRDVRGFDDPFALDLLDRELREPVVRRIRHDWPRTRREAWLGIVAETCARLMGPRTVDIDEALREMSPGFQLVIVGAGLDARAYRMPELSSSTVFELDHPASQAIKRQRTSGLQPRARVLHHVAVDFDRETLAAALERAGHLATTPTAWVFEGVISYLTPQQVESSIAAMSTRSAAGSRLLATYNEEGFVRRFFGRVTARAEPHRAWFSRDEMRALLARHRFVVRSDRDGAERARRHRERPTSFDAVGVRFHHVVVADVLPDP